DRRRGVVRVGEVPVALRGGPVPLRDHADAQHHLEPGAQALSRGLSMSRGDGGRFQPHRRVRRGLGPSFAVACCLATMTGVVVLIALMGAILFPALAGPPHHPWYDVRANAGELLGLLSRLVSNRQSSDPAIAGFR